MATFTVEERLYRTEDDKLVPEGHPGARWQYAAPGDEIPMEEAERYGLTKKRKSSSDDAEEKTKPKAANKAKKPAKTKARRR